MPRPVHQRPTSLKQFLFGCAYYPEHWTDAVRKDDPARMAAAGVNVVRMGEFAWDRMEPRRGTFDFTLFDQTIERLAAAGVATIFCTPTATPPRWLTADHEDWMHVDESGRPMVHGSRQHVCTNNEGFRAESRRITQALAEHFAPCKHIIGWQTDNELYCHFARCYCRSCEQGFRQWLEAKYGTTDALNAAWGTAFWAQTYNSFEQVPLPYPGRRPASANPSQVLDYYRYLSDSVREFQAQQVRILRRARGDWFITHNGLMQHVDYWKFTQDLDFLGVDNYPGFGAREPEDAAQVSFLLEQARAAGGNFIVPEQQAGPGGALDFMLPTSPPGQMRLWAYQSIARGADGIMHFRWRTCRFGSEEYWCGVLDHDSVPRRRYDEFSREGQELKKIGKEILGTVPRVEAAVLDEFDQKHSHMTMPQGLPSPEDAGRLALAQLLRRHLACGLVRSEDDFEGLKLVVVPSMPMMDEDLARRLTAFVKGGGILLVAGRSAAKDRNNHVIGQTPPWLLASMCGCTVQEYGKIDPATFQMVVEPEGKPRRSKAKAPARLAKIPSGAWYEVLQSDGAKVLARWQADASQGPTALAGQPAVTANAYGQGMAIYCGTMLSVANASAIVELALARTGLTPLAQAHDDVEITRRAGSGRTLLFALNHSRRTQQVKGPRGTDLLTGKAVKGQLKLLPYGVAVIRED